MLVLAVVMRRYEVWICVIVWNSDWRCAVLTLAYRSTDRFGHDTATDMSNESDYVLDASPGGYGYIDKKRKVYRTREVRKPKNTKYVLKLEDDLLEGEREKRGHEGRWKASLYEKDKGIEPHDVERQHRMKQHSFDARSAAFRPISGR
jgi:hypothetical protein